MAVRVETVGTEAKWEPGPREQTARRMIVKAGELIPVALAGMSLVEGLIGLAAIQTAIGGIVWGLDRLARTSESKE